VGGGGRIDVQKKKRVRKNVKPVPAEPQDPAPRRLKSIGGWLATAARRSTRRGRKIEYRKKGLTPGEVQGPAEGEEKNQKRSKTVGEVGTKGLTEISQERKDNVRV